VHGRVLGDEHLDVERAFRELVIDGKAQGDAVGGREGFPILIDLLDVLEAGERPVAAGELRGVEVNRIFLAQALEIRLPLVLGKQPRIHRIDGLERHIIGGRDLSFLRYLGVAGHLRGGWG